MRLSPLNRFLLLLLFVAGAVAGHAATELAFPGAEGFGANVRGGRGGRELLVTRLDDDVASPAPGTLRWAVNQPGPRIVRFRVAGTIVLKGALLVTEPFLTLDGYDAPGDGVCLRNHSLHIKNTHDVIVRYLRIRTGDVAVLARVDAAGLERHKGSVDLDCVSIDDSKNVIFDHCSLSWSTDEIFGIVRCENVTIQWCLLAEPLANPRAHPYGDRHAFGLNLSANTLSLHHNLVAHYVMRGPQFEANDVRRGLGYDIRMEAINNVLFDYERSGSRYTTGIEDHPEQAAGTSFEFQFINNVYMTADASRPMIEAVLKHGVNDRLKVYIAGNVGPQRPRGRDADELAGVLTDEKPRRMLGEVASEIRAQISKEKLFRAPVPVTVEPPDDAYRRVLAEAGCSHRRDAVDARIVGDVLAGRFGRVLKSQHEVGGWPELKPAR